MRLLLAGLCVLHAPWAVAWEEKGHSVVGVLAVEQVSAPVRAALAGFLDSMEPLRIASACNWPDRIRDAGLADWTSALHYVNPDPQARDYQKVRDCPTGECLPEAVLRYAQRLGDATLRPTQRKEAFAFLCHFVGDLHQPLHVGYAADKGGNLVTVTYEGQGMNLHRFWDFALIESKVDSLDQLTELLRQRPNPAEPEWSPTDVLAWTNESLTFMRHSAYPAQREIDPGFAAHGWQIILQRLDAGATRLAAVLEAQLGSKPH